MNKIVFTLMLVASSVTSLAADFSIPEKITDSAAIYRLSRTSNSHMGFDSSGVLHAVYWSGDFSTNPTTPSFIWYRTWTAGAGWSPPVSIDDSESGGQHVGGRNPSLVIAPDDSVWVTWHDHRHSSSGIGNWIDNIEIYADRKPFGGNFSTSDLRLTTSAAGHLGDNGYLPRIAPATDGSISVAWYDFHDGGSIGDIYLKTSDTAGTFDLGETMAAMRMTTQSDRSGSPSYTAGDIAVTPDGTRHLVWVGGTASGGDIFYASAAPAAAGVSEIVVATGAGNFFDPPHITAATNGDVWIAYADQTSLNGEDITLLRRRAGQSAFDAPIVITTGSVPQIAPDHAIDASGRVHLVWVDDAAARHVVYAIHDPTTSNTTAPQAITMIDGNWNRPTIELDASGNVYVMFEQTQSILPGGDVWFATDFAPNAVPVASWEAYP